MISAFRDGLKTSGYIEGQNVTIELHWAEDRAERLSLLAAEFVQRQVSVIATGGGDLPVEAAKRATATIPIVFVTARPVESGLVSSLNSPGGNLTGVVDVFTITLGPKRLEVLRQLTSKRGQIVLLNSPIIASDPTAKLAQEAANALGQEIEVLNAGNEREIDAAFATLGQTRPSGLLLISSPLFTNRREQIVALANRYRIPTVYPLREYVVAGGLISYGASIVDAYRQSGAYVARILGGAKPSDLPILQPTKFDLVINLKTANALGVEIPPDLLALADEVIE
jgi:putative ABC transport system substrate-binding protein